MVIHNVSVLGHFGVPRGNFSFYSVYIKYTGG